MKITLFSILTASIAALAYAPAIMAANDMIHVPRDSIISEVEKHIVLADNIRLPANIDRGGLASHITDRLQVLSSQVLPSTLIALDRASLDRALNAPVEFRFADERYVDLRLRKQLMRIEVQLAYELKCPPLSEQQEKLISDSVSPIIDGVRKSMEGRMVGEPPLFRKDAVDAAVDELWKSLKGEIADPDTYWLKLPLPAADATKVLGEFDDRLSQSISRIGPRLDRDAPKNVNGDRNQNAEQFARAAIIREILSPVERVVERSTADASRKIDVSPTVAPDYRKVDNQLWELEVQLSDAESVVHKP